jgi:hydroxypyruvate isomerase
MVNFSVCIEMIYRELPFLERIDAVAESGFSAFEFWGWRSKNIEGIIKRKRKYNLDVSAFMIEPMGRIVDYKTKNEFIKGFKDSVKISKKLECSTLLVTVGNEMKNLQRKEQHENIVNCLRDAAKLAEKDNVTLVLEPLNVLVDHKGYYLYSSSEGFDILNEVNSPNIKLLYDIYHQQITEGNLIETITKNIDLIGHFHVADVPGRHEPGTGEINYVNVFRSINRTKYNGYVGLEFIPLVDTKKALHHLNNLTETNYHSI